MTDNTPPAAASFAANSTPPPNTGPMFAPPDSPPWAAALHLSYAVAGERTVLVERVHTGPLRVQKSLYAEGDAVCQNVIVHPPGGIVGGDTLALTVSASRGSRVQLTTPGATKWYRSVGPAARQQVRVNVAAETVFEWLPREAIVFDGAIVDLDNTIDLAGDAILFAWDLVCLGRSAADEYFTTGALRQRWRIRRDGTPTFIERSRIDGGGALLASPVGLNRAPVYGTFFAAAPSISDTQLVAARGVAPGAGHEGVVTRLPGLLLGRYRGDSTEAAHAYFVELWRALRPMLTGRAAVPLRIWNT